MQFSIKDLLTFSPLDFAAGVFDYHHNRHGRWSHKRKRRHHLVASRRRMAKASRRRNR